MTEQAGSLTVELDQAAAHVQRWLGDAAEPATIGILARDQFGVDAELVPAAYLLRNVPDGDRADLLQRERSLFYVAATRVRDELVVVWEGEGSEFLPGVAGSAAAG